MNNGSAITDSVDLQSLHGAWRQLQAGEQKLLPTGASFVDEKLNGGLVRNGLHEFFGAAKGDAVAAAAFAMMLTLRLPEPQGRIFWVSGDKDVQSSGRLYPPGLAELGIDPSLMVWVQTDNLRDSLRAAADSIRSKAAGAVILEAHGNPKMIDLTSTRRLALAASEKDVLTLLVRGDAVPMPSAAITRWQVRSAPSVPFPGKAPGLPAIDIGLLRHRSGIAPFEAKVIWDHAQRTFHDAPLSGGLPAAAVG